MSIKMAKEQGLSLNPVKISGACGRLMCCLKYEQEAYQDLLRTTPKVGALVSTPEGKGTVTEQNLLTRKLTIRLDKDPDGAPKVFKVSEVKVLRDGKIKVGKKELVLAVKLPPAGRREMDAFFFQAQNQVKNLRRRALGSVL